MAGPVFSDYHIPMTTYSFEFTSLTEEERAEMKRIAAEMEEEFWGHPTEEVIEFWIVKDRNGG